VKLKKSSKQTDEHGKNDFCPMAYAAQNSASFRDRPPMRTFIFGILNITDDSFSDAGRFLDPKAAREHARSLMANGANALDVGAASSNPRSKHVPSEVEIARLKPIVALARKQGWPISIDTFSTETQLWALKAGADYVNDIQGFPDPELYPRLAQSRAKLIVMHSVQERGKAQKIDTDPQSIVGRVADFFEERTNALMAAGVSRDRLVLDPGMGLFVGTKPQVSLMILRRLGIIKSALGMPMMVSVSRKSFLRTLVGRELKDIGPATLAAELYAALHGADMIRTHDPKQLRDALTIWSHISGQSEAGRG
jgi:dihydropteroate synthase type 2